MTLSDIGRNPDTFGLRHLTLGKSGDGPLAPSRIASLSDMRHVPIETKPRRGEPGDWPIPPSAWNLLQPRWIRLLRAFPVAVERGSHGPTIVVAMANPGDLAAIDDIAFATGLRVKVFPVSQEEIDRAIAQVDSENPPVPDLESVPVEAQEIVPPVRRA